MGYLPFWSYQTWLHHILVCSFSDKLRHLRIKRFRSILIYIYYFNNDNWKPICRYLQIKYDDRIMTFHICCHLKKQKNMDNWFYGPTKKCAGINRSSFFKHFFVPKKNRNISALPSCQKGDHEGRDLSLEWKIYYTIVFLRVPNAEPETGVKL